MSISGLASPVGVNLTPKHIIPLENGCSLQSLGMVSWDTRYGFIKVRIPKVDANETIEVGIPNNRSGIFWSMRVFSKGTDLDVSLAQESGDVADLHPASVICDVHVTNKRFLHIEDMPFVYEDDFPSNEYPLYLRVTNNGAETLDLVVVELCFR